jgi:hypothetical protein
MYEGQRNRGHSPGETHGYDEGWASARPDTWAVYDQFLVRIRGVEVRIGTVHERPPRLTIGDPTTISANRQNRLLSAGMPLVERVGGLILPEDCQDQN